jgi:hypothetical protein
LLKAAAFQSNGSFEGEGRGITPSMNGFALLVRLGHTKRNGLIADDARNILAVHDGRPFRTLQSGFDVNTGDEDPASY